MLFGGSGGGREGSVEVRLLSPVRPVLVSLSNEGEEVEDVSEKEGC